MIKFGNLLPIPNSPPANLIKIAKRCEELGFDSVWVVDHLLMIPTGIVPEALTLLSAIAIQTNKVLIGTCVSDPHRRHPAVFAQMVATIDQISNGRMIVGLGPGEAMNLEQFGIDWSKPVSKMEEFTNAIRELWEKDIVNFDGKFWRFKNAFLQIKPAQKQVPIYFGANGKRTRELTAKLADGWLPTPRTPELYKKNLEEIKQFAEKIGRKLSNFEACLYVYVAAAERREDALNQLKKIKPIIAFFPKVIKEAGYDVNIPEKLSDNLYSMIRVDEVGMKLYEEFGKYIPDEVVEAFSIVGTPSECEDKVEEFVKAGVRHFVIVNTGPDPRFVMKMFSERIIPVYKEVS